MSNKIHKQEYKNFTIIIEKLKSNYSTGEPMLMSNNFQVVCFIQPDQEPLNYVDECKRKIDEYLKYQSKCKE